MVVGVRLPSKQHASLLRRLASTWFYRILNAISEIKVIPGATDYRLLDRLAIDEFNHLTEHNRLTRGLIDWLGFRQAFVYYHPSPRFSGSANYSYRKLIRLAIQSCISMSLMPLKLAGYVGLVIVAVSFPLGCFIFIEKYLLNDPWNLQFSGTAILALVLLFLVGIVLVCLGLMALYIANIYSEVLRRPLYVIRKARRF